MIMICCNFGVYFSVLSIFSILLEVVRGIHQIVSLKTCWAKRNVEFWVTAMNFNMFLTLFLRCLITEPLDTRGSLAVCDKRAIYFPQINTRDKLIIGSLNFIRVNIHQLVALALNHRYMNEVIKINWFCWRHKYIRKENAYHSKDIPVLQFFPV